MTKQERILKAIKEQNDLYTMENMKLREEEKQGNFTYDKSVFNYRKQKCSNKYAVDYIKKYYPEIKVSKKKLTEMIKESDIVKYAGKGTIGFVSSSSFNGVGRSSYDLLEMDSIDMFAVSLIEGLE